MIKLSPVLKNYIWGGKKLADMYGRDNGGDKISESWEASVHHDGTCMAGEQTFAQYLQQNPTAVDSQGSPFPVLIKYIDSAQNLSVQVHPDDAFANRWENDNGKTEMWYIVDADKGAGIYCGFCRDVTKEEFLLALQQGSVENLLNFIPVKQGDCFLIEAGTVHAIGAGCVICEIQQNSNVTYRVYDYNRRDANGNLRPLHIDKAVQVINFKAYNNTSCSGLVVQNNFGTIQLLTKCKYFCCHKLTLTNPQNCYSNVNEQSFTVVNVLQGNGSICGQPFTAGDCFFVPCGQQLCLCGKAQIILTTK